MQTMALTKELKQQIGDLPQHELAKLVFKIVNKDKVFLDYIKLTYFKDEINETDIFKSYKNKITIIVSKHYKGYVDEEKAANYIAECNKQLMNFEKITKNKEYLLELILTILDNAYNDFGAKFGTCFTAFEYRFHLLLKKAIKIVTTQMHEDMLIEYQEHINTYLKLIKKSNYLDYIYNLPDEI
jgi:hypothetical protein